MSEMVRKASLELAKQSGINDWAKSAFEFEDDARTVIGALMEPSPAMIAACEEAVSECKSPRYICAIIIAAALGETTTAQPTPAVME